MSDFLTQRISFIYFKVCRSREVWLWWIYSSVLSPMPNKLRTQSQFSSDDQFQNLAVRIEEHMGRPSSSLLCSPKNTVNFKSNIKDRNDSFWKMLKWFMKSISVSVSISTNRDTFLNSVKKFLDLFIFKFKRLRLFSKSTQISKPKSKGWREHRVISVFWVQRLKSPYIHIFSLHF